MLKIEHAKIEHWQEIEKVLSRVWGDDDYVAIGWRYNVENPENMITLTALWDDRPVGTCHIALKDKTAWFHAMRIDPDFQGKGIAVELSRFAIAEAKARGIKRCMAAIDSDNIPSQKMTKRVGFELLYEYEALSPAEGNTNCSEVLDENLWHKAPLEEAEEFLALHLPQLLYPQDMLMIGWTLVTPKVEEVKDALCWDERDDGGEGEKSCFFNSWRCANAVAYAAIYDFDEDALVMSPVIDDLSRWQEALIALEQTMQKKEKAVFCIWLTPEDPLYDITIKAGYKKLPDKGYQIWQLLL